MFRFVIAVPSMWRSRKSRMPFEALARICLGENIPLFRVMISTSTIQSPAVVKAESGQGNGRQVANRSSSVSSDWRTRFSGESATPSGVIIVRCTDLRVRVAALKISRRRTSFAHSSFERTYSPWQNLISQRFVTPSARSITRSICAPSRSFASGACVHEQTFVRTPAIPSAALIWRTCCRHSEEREIVDELEHLLLLRLADGGKRPDEAAFFERFQAFRELASVGEGNGGEDLGPGFPGLPSGKRLQDLDVHPGIPEQRAEQALELAAQFSVLRRRSARSAERPTMSCPDSSFIGAESYHIYKDSARMNHSSVRNL